MGWKVHRSVSLPRSTRSPSPMKKILQKWVKQKFGKRKHDWFKTTRRTIGLRVTLASVPLSQQSFSCPERGKSNDQNELRVKRKRFPHYPFCSLCFPVDFKSQTLIPNSNTQNSQPGKPKDSKGKNFCSQYGRGWGYPGFPPNIQIIILICSADR